MKNFQKNTLCTLISITLAASFSFSAAASSYNNEFSRGIRPNTETPPPTTSQNPTAHFYSPAEGESIQYGDVLRVNFTTPSKAQATSLTLNGVELLNAPVAPNQDFYQVYFHHTYNVGLQTLVLTLETEDGKQFKQERHYQVVNYSRFIIDTPEPYQVFSVNDTVPITFTESSLDATSHYIIRVDGEDVKTITKAPYEYDYQLSDNARSEVKISVISVSEDNEELEEESVYIRVNQFKNGLTVLPAIEEGSAALKVGENATFIADIRNDQTHEPLTAEEAKKQIEQVDFYLNHQKIGSDSTPPYEHAWVNKISLGRYGYSDTNKLEIRVRSTDYNYGGESSQEKDLQVMPELGRDYCKTKAPVWNAERQYQPHELVRYNGFFYKANQGSKNVQPANPKYDSIWLAQNCDQDILRDSEIQIEIDKPKTATIGEVVTINGKITLPEDIRLQKLVVLENGGWHLDAREIKVNADNTFSFAHKFKGNGQCFYTRCDTLDLKAFNNLGYESTAFTSINEGVAPTITAVYTEEQFGRTNLTVMATDDRDQLKVEVYDGDRKLGQAYMDVVRSYNENGGRVFLQAASLSLNLRPGDYTLTVVVRDIDGNKSTQEAFVKVSDPYSNTPSWNY